MQNTYNILKSRTFWTLVVMGLIPAINLFVVRLSPDLQAIIEPLLGLLAAYFHNSTAVSSGATN